MTVTKIYHSRESLIATIHSEDERVKWDDTEADEKKISEASVSALEHTEKMDASVDDYLNAMYEEDEDAAAHMSHCRREVIERWALAQAALSKLAWVMRFDGNDAYQRMITAIDTGTEVNMQGL